MPSARRTRFVDWAVCLVIFLIGLFFLIAGEFSRRYGTTPEAELTVVTGPATNATLSRVQGTQYVRFTIQGQTVDYSSDLRGYPKVISAIERGEPMTIGVSTKRETLLPRSGWVALYTLSIGGEQLLTYQDTITKGYRGSNAPYILAAVLLTIGGWGLFACFRNRNRDPNFTPLTPQQLAAAWNDPRRIRLGAALISAAMCGAVLIAVLHPESTPTSIAVFGERPLGLPLRLFVFLFFSLLLVPVPIGAWHLFRIVARSASQGAGFSKGEILSAIVRVPNKERDLRRSRLIVIGVGLFYLLLMAGWIWYADSRGI